MVYSTYKLQRILYYYFQGYKAPTISQLLREENLRASRVGIAKFLKKYKETGSIGRRPGSGRPSRITSEIKAIVEQQMRKDDETTATQLHTLLSDHGYSVSLRTILRCRTSLGWTFRGSSYCQLIREANKHKRLAWAQEYRTYKDEDFADVIFTDESTIQLETHRRFCCRKRGEPPKAKPRLAFVVHVDTVVLSQNNKYMLELQVPSSKPLKIILYSAHHHVLNPTPPPPATHTHTHTHTQS